MRVFFLVDYGKKQCIIKEDLIFDNRKNTSLEHEVLRKKRFWQVFILAVIVSQFTGELSSADDFLRARVKDISDRGYEQALIPLLDNARESIVISMYSISPGKEGVNNPVKLLLNDLLEARARGVKVKLYLNTRFRGNDKINNNVLENPAFKKLQDAGCKVSFLPYSRRLHDKLIIIDKRYVVEGSTNWSVSALRSNYESSTLIDSADLARIKLERIKNIMLQSAPRKEKSYSPSYIEGLPEKFSIPKALLLDKKHFPRMFTKHERSGMNVYILMLVHSQVTGKEEFSLSLEDMALSIGLPDSWSYMALREGVIEALKRLEERYNLIRVKFFYGRNAEIELLPVRGESFEVQTDIIIQPNNPRLTMRLKYLFMIKALLKDEGEDMSASSTRMLAKRFHIDRDSIAEALRTLPEYKAESVINIE